MKQETIEEAAEKQWGKLAIINDRAAVIAFKAGAKWQQEQDKNKYSEKDMKEAFRVGFNVGYNDEESPSYLTFEKWFEQFKKK